MTQSYKNKIKNQLYFRQPGDHGSTTIVFCFRPVALRLQFSLDLLLSDKCLFTYYKYNIYNRQ